MDKNKLVGGLEDFLAEPMNCFKDGGAISLYAVRPTDPPIKITDPTEPPIASLYAFEPVDRY